MGAARRKGAFAAAIAVALVAVACGTSDHGVFGPGHLENQGTSGDDASGGGSGASGDDGGDNTFNTNPLADAATIPLDALMGCASNTVQAKELPLDLYVMLDSSGSMDDLVAEMTSKWTSVVSAMTGFVNDPASAGIGVGLQYFPLDKAGVPASCTASSQCGTAGPCMLHACDLRHFSPDVYPCDTPADCNGYQCQAIGFCHNDANTICLPGQGDCTKDANGFTLGACDAITSANCALGDSCATGDYATPAVPIGLLPGGAMAITTSLAAHHPNGNTPTVAALQGAVDQAKAYATANPGHSVVAVLATDGDPDECVTDVNESLQQRVADVAAVAQRAFTGTPSIKTFVVGVFTPDVVASHTTLMDQIATAGGTSKAFVVSTGQNVEQQFTAALDAIRGASLPCQYSVPLPEGGTPNFDLVNVEYTTGAGVTSGLPYVGSASRCGAGGGWYYDVDPSQSVPSAILVCPSTCTGLTGDTKGRVDVVIGCATIAR